MKKILFSLTVLFALCLASCSSDKSADAGALLATIPSDASFVATVNLYQLLEKSGCKVKGSEIEPGKEVKNLLAKDSKSQESAFAKAFFNGKSGVDPSVAVAFQLGYYTYITGILADPATFKAMIENETHSSFENNDGVETADNIAMANNQFWINIGQHSIDPKEIEHFLKLDASQSFAQSAYADKLSEITTDIAGWGNISGLLNTASLGFQERATVQVALQTLFEDPSAMTFTVNFDKNKLLSEAYVLNSKGKNAKFLLPTEAVDMKTIDQLQGKASALCAVSIPNKLIKKLQDETKSKSTSVLGLFLDQLKSVDGTVAVAYSKDSDSLEGIVSTDGQNLTNLTSMLSSFRLDSKIEGNIVRVSKGAGLTAGTPVSELAAHLKGAVAGVAVSGTELGNEMPKGIFTFTLCANGNSLMLKATVETADKNQSLLKTILEK